MTVVVINIVTKKNNTLFSTTPDVGLLSSSPALAPLAFTDISFKQRVISSILFTKIKEVYCVLFRDKTKILDLT